VVHGALVREGASFITEAQEENCVCKHVNTPALKSGYEKRWKKVCEIDE